MRRALEQWIERLRARADAIPEDDEAALRSLGRLVRFALQIMQASLLDALDGDAVVALTAAWITRTLEMAVGPNRTSAKGGRVRRV